jgi:hypothetical protein
VEEEEEEEEEPEDVRMISIWLPFESRHDLFHFLTCLHSCYLPLRTLNDSNFSQPQPIFREQCQNSAKCAPLKHHFEHCQEKVQGGQGSKGEDCVEEM